MATETTKKTLSDSAFRMLTRCGMQFYWRYIEGIRIPPGISALIGTATDTSVSTDLSFKRTTGKLRMDEDIKDIARDAVNGNWLKGVRLVGDELKESQKKLKGEAVDDAVTLSTLHHRELAPDINPVDVQRFWKIELPNYPYDITGRIDIEEPDAIRDTKTSAKSPTWDEAHKSKQLTMYALARKITRGVMSKTLYLDFLIRTKTPKYLVLPTERNQEDFDAIFVMYDKAMEILEKEAFMPNNDGWHCSDKWCGYWQDKCPFGRRSQSSSYPTVEQRDQAEKTRERMIGPKKKARAK